ncbi:MAG: hypothetical protein ABJA82_09240 [Myxococcales bacterium]
MNRTTFRSLLLMGSAVFLVAGCGGPVAPANPTWEHDIHPLLVARCIRCHEGAGNLDPLTPPGPLSHAAPVGLNFDYPTLPVPVPPSISVLSVSGPMSVRGPNGLLPRMPPPPAEALEDWQIDMLANWAVEDPLR